MFWFNVPPTVLLRAAGRAASMGTGGGSAAEDCHALLLCRAFKTVVFVIDQLEAFMRAAKQTLLYNVLDALQHSQVQVRSASSSSSGTARCR